MSWEYVSWGDILADQMAVPPRLVEPPTRDELSTVLARLAAYALRPHWILEKGRLLLGLDCVRVYVAADAIERDYPAALRAYLEHAVERIESPESRTILEVVFGLGDDEWKSKAWRHRSAVERRKRAGETFRGGEEMVTASTIRKLHEPRAVGALAEIIWRDEREARNMSIDED